MTLSWPADLPRPERDTWRASRNDGRLSTQQNSGPMRTRRRFSSVSKPVNLSIFVDRNGKAIFDSFFDDVTAGGARPFLMPDPTTDGWPLLMHDGTPVLTTSGVPLLLAANWLCLFGQTMPSEAVKGVYFRISFSIEVMP